jgi:hypothetical protein
LVGNFENEDVEVDINSIGEVLERMWNFNKRNRDY